MRSFRSPACFLVVFLVATACTVPVGESPRAQDSRPNLVILYTDDQGYGDCSTLNPDSKFQTPQLDRLARAGMTFTDAHSADSVCTPSRYALLTGRYAWRTRMKRGVLGADGDCLLRGQQTLATALRDRGYDTGIVGKWHLGMQIAGTKGQRDWSQPVTDGPLQHGFDSFYGIPASMNFGVLTWFEGDRALAPASMWTRKKFPPAEIVTQPLDYRMAPPFDETRRGRGDIEVAPTFRDEDVLRIITERVVQYLAEAAARPAPFFLYVPFTSPHLPHCTAPEFRGKSSMGNYGDFMHETDVRVGQILDALERHDLAANTIVIFSSDNGPENNYRDWLKLYGHASNGGFRGGKRDVHEGGHRVPFFVRWPGVVEPGSFCRTPICQTDIYATIADALGLELPDDVAVDSVSFLPQLRGEAAAPRPPIVHHSASGHFALRSGRYKFIPYRPRRGGRPRPVGPDEDAFELYDLVADPRETTNIVARQPAVANRLRAELTAIVRRGRTTAGRALANDGPAWWPQLTWIARPPK